MYKHILVPIAPDHEGAAGVSLRIAEHMRDEGGRITLLTVKESTPSYIDQYIPSEVKDNIARELDEMLGRLAADVAGKVDTRRLVGDPGRAIVEYAEANDVDCVVIASHRPGLEDYVFGSTAAWVARHCPCSVHVVR